MTKGRMARGRTYNRKIFPIFMLQYVGLAVVVKTISGLSAAARMGFWSERCGFLSIEQCAVSYLLLGGLG